MEKKIGSVDDFFAKVCVAALKLESDLQVGETIHIKGHTTDITQQVQSMQIQHEAVTKAKKGDSIGIKVDDRVRKGDTIYKVVP